jgi:L-lactate dehydrogenase
MKLGIVGTGNVGCAIALAAVTRGSAGEIVLVNRTAKVAEAVATDLRYGTPLGPRLDISHGGYDALRGAGVVLITSGVNEKTGGATDRSDPLGRLRLLEKNAAIYREIVPQIVKAAPASGARRRYRSARSSGRYRTHCGWTRARAQHRNVS